MSDVMQFNEFQHALNVHFGHQDTRDTRHDRWNERVQLASVVDNRE